MRQGVGREATALLLLAHYEGSVTLDDCENLLWWLCYYRIKVTLGEGLDPHAASRWVAQYLDRDRIPHPT